MGKISIALDGPSAAGKSTLARKAANHFGFIYVDTGALYRCVGLYTLRKNIGSKDEAGVTALLDGIKLEMKYDSMGVQRVILCGEDVTDQIRTPQASKYASDVSAMPSVRAFLLSMQRDMAKMYDVIMDGRDIGTVVLPDAALKVFITADLGTRAKRRYIELQGQGITTTLDEVMQEMAIRDENDSKRETAPLKVADDAVLLDTTYMDLEQSFSTLCGMIAGRFGL